MKSLVSSSELSLEWSLDELKKTQEQGQGASGEQPIKRRKQKPVLTPSERAALRAQRAQAKIEREVFALQVMASLPADASGREIIAALRQKDGTLSAAQQAAKDRAKQKRAAKGRANKAKAEAKTLRYRAAKEEAKQQQIQAKADAAAAQLAAVIAATVW